MRCCHKQVFYVVLIYGLHALYSASASVLVLEVIKCHSLDISEISHSYNCALIRNKILHVDFGLIIADGCSSVITVFIGDCNNLLTDDHKKLLLVC